MCWVTVAHSLTRTPSSAHAASSSPVREASDETWLELAASCDVRLLTSGSPTARIQFVNSRFES